MPALVVVPASFNDLEAVTRVQFDAWKDDAGFKLIFPKGPTPDTVQHCVNQLENDMDNDLTRHLMLVKDAMTHEVAAYAIWHFYPLRGHDDIEREMLTDHFPLPRDANLEVGNRLIHNGVRKHHEVVAKQFGRGAPHAFLSALGTSPTHSKQGAASMLVTWGVERADDLQIPCYLEATPAARNVYLRLGFTEVDQLKLELPTEGEHQNFCMIRPVQT